MNIENIV